MFFHLIFLLTFFPLLFSRPFQSGDQIQLKCQNLSVKVNSFGILSVNASDPRPPDYFILRDSGNVSGGIHYNPPRWHLRIAGFTSETRFLSAPQGGTFGYAVYAKPTEYPSQQELFNISWDENNKTGSILNYWNEGVGLRILPNETLFPNSYFGLVESIMGLATEKTVFEFILATAVQNISNGDNFSYNNNNNNNNYNNNYNYNYDYSNDGTYSHYNYYEIDHDNQIKTYVGIAIGGICGIVMALIVGNLFRRIVDRKFRKRNEEELKREKEDKKRIMVENAGNKNQEMACFKDNYVVNPSYQGYYPNAQIMQSPPPNGAPILDQSSFPLTYPPQNYLPSSAGLSSSPPSYPLPNNPPPTSNPPLPTSYPPVSFPPSSLPPSSSPIPPPSSCAPSSYPPPSFYPPSSANPPTSFYPPPYSFPPSYPPNSYNPSSFPPFSYPPPSFPPPSSFPLSSVNLALIAVSPSLMTRIKSLGMCLICIFIMCIISLSSKSQHLIRINSIFKSLIMEYYSDVYNGLVGCIVMDVFLIIGSFLVCIILSQPKKKKKSTFQLISGAFTLLFFIRIILGFIFILGNQQMPFSVVRSYTEEVFWDTDYSRSMTVACIYECVILIFGIMIWGKLALLTKKKI